jgi:hypothetical protein
MHICMHIQGFVHCPFITKGSSFPFPLINQWSLRRAYLHKAAMLCRSYATRTRGLWGPWSRYGMAPTQFAMRNADNGGNRETRPHFLLEIPRFLLTITLDDPTAIYLKLSRWPTRFWISTACTEKRAKICLKTCLYARFAWLELGSVLASPFYHVLVLQSIFAFSFLYVLVNE